MSRQRSLEVQRAVAANLVPIGATVAYVPDTPPLSLPPTVSEGANARSSINLSPGKHRPGYSRQRRRKPKPREKILVPYGEGRYPQSMLLKDAPIVQQYGPRVKEKALAIFALEMEGKTKTEIAQTLQIAEQTVTNYKYIAGHEGWLPRHDPKDVLQFDLAHKMVRNLNDMLDSEDPKVKHETTMKALEGTLFKSFVDTGQPAQQSMNVLAVQIIQPEGATVSVRPGTIVCTPGYIVEDKGLI